MKATFSIIGVVLLAIALSATGATGAKTKPPKTGIYEAVPKLKKGDESYQPGSWVVIKNGSKLEMVRNPVYSGIFWPERSEGCNPYSVGLAAESVPISKSGRFHVKEKIAIAGTDETISVDWAGRWTNATKLKGKVKLAIDGCRETIPYTGSREGPVPAS